MLRNLKRVQWYSLISSLTIFALAVYLLSGKLGAAMIALSYTALIATTADKPPRGEGWVAKLASLSPVYAFVAILLGLGYEGFGHRVPNNGTLNGYMPPWVLFMFWSATATCSAALIVLCSKARVKDGQVLKLDGVLYHPGEYFRTFWFLKYSWSTIQTEQIFWIPAGLKHANVTISVRVSYSFDAGLRRLDEEALSEKTTGYLNRLIGVRFATQPFDKAFELVDYYLRRIEEAPVAVGVQLTQLKLLTD